MNKPLSKFKFAFYFILITSPFLLLLSKVSILDLILPVFVSVIIAGWFYANVLDGLVYKAELFEEAKDEYVESLGRYRGTLNSDDGLPEGWVIIYDNSYDKHKAWSEDEKGDDKLPFVMDLHESGCLEIKGTPSNPLFTFTPVEKIEKTLKEEQKIKIKVFRDGVTIYNLRFEDK